MKYPFTQYPSILKHISGKFISLLLFFLLVGSALAAQELFIAAGAGYKKPVTEAAQKFEAVSGVKINAVFGNLQAVITQAKQTDEISCIVGDRKFLEKVTSVLQFSSFKPIGKGILVLAYRKGISLTKVEDLLSPEIKTVFMPDKEKAIYGIAATELLEGNGMKTQLAGKLYEAATVPQVVAYLLAGEADAGFINLTEALANKDKLGGYLIIPQDKYTEIEISAGIVKGFESQETTQKFVDFIGSGVAAAVFARYGLTN